MPTITDHSTRGLNDAKRLAKLPPELIVLLICLLVPSIQNFLELSIRDFSEIARYEHPRLLWKGTVAVSRCCWVLFMRRRRRNPAVSVAPRDQSDLLERQFKGII